MRPPLKQLRVEIDAIEIDGRKTESEIQRKNVLDGDVQICDVDHPIDLQPFGQRRCNVALSVRESQRANQLNEHAP